MSHILKIYHGPETETFDIVIVNDRISFSSIRHNINSYNGHESLRLESEDVDDEIEMIPLKGRAELSNNGVLISTFIPRVKTTLTTRRFGIDLLERVSKNPTASREEVVLANEMIENATYLNHLALKESDDYSATNVLFTIAHTNYPWIKELIEIYKNEDLDLSFNYRRNFGIMDCVEIVVSRIKQ